MGLGPKTIGRAARSNIAAPPSALLNSLTPISGSYWIPSLTPTETEICPNGIKDLTDAMPIADRKV